MKCPYCGCELVWGPEELCTINVTHEDLIETGMERETWVLSHKRCGECKRPLIVMIRHLFRLDPFGGGPFSDEIGEPKLQPLWPRTGWRERCPPEVPEEVAVDYNEACAVIDISPTAAAALARRCMQLILVNEAGAPKSKSLKQQIEAVVNDPNTPKHVKNDLDDLRQIGNLSAHANEDVTGQVLRAEPDEAEWTLETLRTLFEHYYVGLAKSKARKAALKAKLAKKVKE